MYLSFYKLGKMPFQITSDPEFLWVGEKHRESLASLKYGILDNKGFLLLTGDIGTGKTTLINSLVRSLGEEVIIARVPDPGMDKLDFMNFISHAFKMEMKFKRKNKFLIRFSQFLNDAYADDKKVLLIIDEAQRLNEDLLEEIRLLSNIEKPERKLLNIFLIGQNEFNNILNLDSCRALRQRISINQSLEPLNAQETGEMIEHRLRVAGAQYNIFDTGAILAVHAYAEGVPRRINIICDNCLTAGFIKVSRTIPAEIVESCAQILNLPSYSGIRLTDSTRPGTPDIPENSDETPSANESLTTPTIPAPVLQETSYAPAWRTSAYVGLFVTLLFSAVYIPLTRSGMEVFPWPRQYNPKVFSDILVLDAVTSNRVSETDNDAMPYGESKLLPARSLNEDGATPRIPTGKEVETVQPAIYVTQPSAPVTAQKQPKQIQLQKVPVVAEQHDKAERHPSAMSGEQIQKASRQQNKQEADKEETIVTTPVATQPAVATPAALSFKPEISHLPVEAIRQTIPSPPAVSETKESAMAQKQQTDDQPKAESKAVLEAVAQIIAYSGKAADKPISDGEEKQENDPSPEKPGLGKNRPAGTPHEKEIDASEIIDWLLMKHAK